jgi:hypothetical protein
VPTRRVVRTECARPTRLTSKGIDYDDSWVARIGRTVSSPTQWVFVRWCHRCRFDRVARSCADLSRVGRYLVSMESWPVSVADESRHKVETKAAARVVASFLWSTRRLWTIMGVRGYDGQAARPGRATSAAALSRPPESSAPRQVAKKPSSPDLSSAKPMCRSARAASRED